MKQLDLFGETGELQPIQKWLHVWDEAKREAANKKAREEAGKLRGGKPEGGIHQAASFSDGRDDNSGHISRQLERKC